MRRVSSSFSLAVVVGACSALTLQSCSGAETDLPVDDPCAQLGLELYEFEPVGTEIDGTFEPGSDGEFGTPTPGTMLIDDDDLTDDYRQYVDALQDFENFERENEALVETFENIDPDLPSEEWSATEVEAVELVAEFSASLKTDCTTYEDPVPGEPIEPPTFVSCKDAWNESGDGVLGFFELAEGLPQDQEMASCPSLGGGDNAHALNFWGPLSTFEDGTGREVPYDGFTFSGLTVPVALAAQVFDLSEWDGVALWARVADADEAVPIQPAPGGKEPLAGDDIPDGARPQDGAGQLAVIIQTVETAAIDSSAWKNLTVCGENEVPEGTLSEEEAMTSSQEEAFCVETLDELEEFPGELIDETEDGEPLDQPHKIALRAGDGTPIPIPQPFCNDFSPVDAPTGEEDPFRTQCWDGFRTMMEITRDWKFYFFPFDEMRQAGWGQVADEFRLDHVRSVNLLTSAFQAVNVMVDEVVLYRRKADD